MIPVSRRDAVDYRAVYDLRADFLLNATPVGMHPALADCPVEPERISGLTGVADVIYNPARTRLLQRAQGAGLQTAGGLGMLGAPAAGSARRFLGAPCGAGPRGRKPSAGWPAKPAPSPLSACRGSGKSTVARVVPKGLGAPPF